VKDRSRLGGGGVGAGQKARRRREPKGGGVGAAPEAGRQAGTVEAVDTGTMGRGELVGEA
jgi:hypothetical protein